MKKSVDIKVCAAARDTEDCPCVCGDRRNVQYTKCSGLYIILLYVVCCFNYCVLLTCTVCMLCVNIAVVGALKIT